MKTEHYAAAEAFQKHFNFPIRSFKSQSLKDTDIVIIESIAEPYVLFHEQLKKLVSFQFTNPNNIDPKTIWLPTAKVIQVACIKHDNPNTTFQDIIDKFGTPTYYED